MQTLKHAPLNSIVFICDEGAEPPIPIWGAKILATASCVSIACYPEIDGDTELQIGGFAEVDPGSPSEFEGDIDTPTQTLRIETVNMQVLITERVGKKRVRLSIWRSHPLWPEKVIIGWS